MNNLVLLMLTALRSKIRNGTATETDIAQAFGQVTHWSVSFQQNEALEELHAQLLAGGDRVRIMNRFIHQHELHDEVSLEVSVAERMANAERQKLANAAAAQVNVIARALYPEATTMVLSGSFGNFTLGACLDNSDELIEDSLNDGELTGLNRLLGLIRTAPANGTLIVDELTGHVRVMLDGPVVDPAGPKLVVGRMIDKKLPPVYFEPPVDPIHKALGFIPVPGQFNVKVVDQDKYWVNGAGGANEVADFDVEWANRIIGYLVKRTKMVADYVLWRETHSGAAVEEMSDVANDVFQEFLRRTPSQMLEDTRLMKALRALVDGE